MKCKKCGNPKTEDQFRITNTKTGRRRKHCDDCQRKYQTSWHVRNKEVHNSAINQDRKRRKEIEAPVIRQLKSNPCMDCGKSFPYYVMDFDHRPDEKKSFEIAKSLYRYGLERVLAEINKCDLLCANCHRIRTHKRQFPDGGGASV